MHGTNMFREIKILKSDNPDIVLFEIDGIQGFISRDAKEMECGYCRFYRKASYFLGYCGHLERVYGLTFGSEALQMTYESEIKKLRTENSIKRIIGGPVKLINLSMESKT